MALAEPRIYRATLEAWVGKLALPLAFFVVLTFTAVEQAGLEPWIGGLGLLLVLWLFGVQYLAPMLRNWLQVDERRLEGSLNGRRFSFYWTEVLAAWIFERRQQRFLCIGTRSGTLVLPLRFLNAAAIWRQVQGSVPPEALDEKAIQKLPEYNEWQSAHREQLESERPATVTDHWLIQAGGWAALTFFLLSFTEELSQGKAAWAVIFGLLIVASGLILLSWGITEFGPQHVERNSLFKGGHIDWDEVRWIEVDPFDMVLVLVGEQRTLVLPGPGLWIDRNRGAALAMLLAQTEKRRIPLRRTLGALVRLTRSPRVKK